MIPEKTLNEMTAYVVVSHRQYFREVMSHLTDDPNNQSILLLMVTVTISVINDLKPTMPSKNFATELGFFLLDFLLNSTLGRVITTPLTALEQARLILSNKATVQYFDKAAHAFREYYGQLIH